jgi:hypothetical protein
MEILNPQNNPSAAFYLLFPDVKLYFDSECSDTGVWILKATNLPGDVVGTIRDKEQGLWSNNKGKYVCSSLIERTSYKLMIEIKLAKNFIILDNTGIPIKPGEMVKGDVYTFQIYAKEWKVRHRIGYTFYAESGILKLKAPVGNNKPFVSKTEPILANNKPFVSKTEPILANNKPFVSKTEPILANNKRSKKLKKEPTISTKQFEKLMAELCSDTNS